MFMLGKKKINQGGNWEGHNINTQPVNENKTDDISVDNLRPYVLVVIKGW